MWISRWFKPVQKIQPTEEVTLPVKKSPEVPSTPLKQLCQSVDVDRICKDPVMRRYLITVYWPDVESLFEATLNNKRGPNSLIAVNLHSYFKTAGSPASVCLVRLSDILDSIDAVPHGVSADINVIVNTFNQLGNRHPELKIDKE